MQRPLVGDDLHPFGDAADSLQKNVIWKNCMDTLSLSLFCSLFLSLLTGVGAIRIHACPSCLALAFLRQDEEIGWDDDVLQTEGFPVLEEFLATWLKMAAQKVCGRVDHMTWLQKPTKNPHRYCISKEV